MLKPSSFLSATRRGQVALCSDNLCRCRHTTEAYHIIYLLREHLYSLHWNERHRKMRAPLFVILCADLFNNLGIQ